MRRLLLGVFSIVVVAICIGVFSQAAHAATFVVDSTGDGGNTGGPGVCDDGSGACTLRAAIEAANATAGADIVNFNIAGAGVHTITPTSVYPNITEQLTIDGTTQPGSSCGTLVPSIPAASNTPHVLNIEIDNSAGSYVFFDTGSAGSLLKGINIHSAPDTTWSSVYIGDNNITVECNYIGTDQAGASSVGNPAGSGVYVSQTFATGTVVQNNLISGNQNQAIFITGSGTIQRNLLGTDAAGTTAIANFAGINAYDYADDVTVDTNVMSGSQVGMYKNSAFQTGTPDFIITNNFVGLGLTGGSIPNSFSIDIRYIQSAVFTGNTADNNGQVGLQALEAHSIIATTNTTNGNGSGGMNFDGTDTAGDSAVVSSNIADGNLAGGGIIVSPFDTVQALNNTASNNTGDGIYIEAYVDHTVSNNTVTNNSGTGMAVGDLTAGQVNNNTVSNNGGDGLRAIGDIFDNITNNNGGYGLIVNGGNAHDNMMDSNNIGMNLAGNSTTIVNHNTMINSISNGMDVTASGIATNNYIGLKSDGTIASNAGDGIFIIGGGVNLGGTTAAERNYISGNTGSGVHLFACGTNVTSGSVITGNYIGTNLTGTIQSGYGNGGSGIEINEQSLVGCGGGGGGSIYQNIIGGDAAGATNTIAGNGADGIRVYQAPGMDVFSNAILPNTIFGNTNLGINLAADSTNSGVADQDLGPNAINNYLMSIPALNANYYLNHPTINSSTFLNNQLTVNYNFDANQADNVTLQQSNVVGYRLDFYINNTSQDGAYAGFNQGKTHLGYFIVNGSETNASHTFTSPIPLSTSQSVNAEATVLWTTPGPPYIDK